MTDKVSYLSKTTGTTVVALWNILQHTVFHCEVMAASDSFPSNCGRLPSKIHRVVWKNKHIKRHSMPVMWKIVPKNPKM
jgi:hypothetical protein